MKTIAYILFGYRDDLSLNQFWWHRLAVVMFIITGVALILLAALIVGDARYVPTAAMVGLSVVASTTILTLNLYYRGLVYVLRGPRKKLA